MKYIRTKRFGIIIFSSLIQHRVMAQSLGESPDDIISAGFVMTVDGPDVIKCFGDSVSLNKKSAPEDTFLLRKELGLEI